VITYTNIVNEIKRGNIPEWAPGRQQVPNIAKDYWRLGQDATMLDLILAVRADEASHRFTNHTLANLDKDDFNPLAMKHAPPEIEGGSDGFTREQSKEWLEQVKREMHPEESQAKKQEEAK
jgi:ubiquinol oxidase